MPSTPSTSITPLNSQYSYQYNYYGAYGNGPGDSQHRQLHRIWETDEEGELLVNKTISNDLPTTTNLSEQQYMFLDVYLPNGLLLPIQCQTHRTIALLKQDVFIQARKYPLGASISDISNYIFMTIGLDGAHIQLYDEQKPVSSLQNLFLPLLVLAEPEGNKMEKELNQQIGYIMGITLMELERKLNEELQNFRLRLFETCLEAERERGTYQFLHYAFPEGPLLQQQLHPGANSSQFGANDPSDHPLEIERRALEKLRQKMQSSDAYVEVWYGVTSTKTSSENQKEVDFEYSVRIRNILGATPEDVLRAALNEFRTQYSLDIRQPYTEFILQIAGQQVYVTRPDVALTQFVYIRSCFENYRIPRLIIREKSLVFMDYPPPPKIFEPSYVLREMHNQYLNNETLTNGTSAVPDCNISDSSSGSTKQKQRKLFWDLDENLRIQIHSASNITVQDSRDHLFVRVAVAVGRHVLDVKDSVTVTSSNPRWGQETFIDFDIYLKDLPESAQLCFSLISIHNPNSSSSDISKITNKNKQRTGTPTLSTASTSMNCELNSLGYANLHVFDWRSRLIQGKQTLFLRPYEKNRSSFSPQFVHLDNEYGDALSTVTSRTPRLEIEMPEYFGGSTIIEYPPDLVIQRYIRWLRRHRGRKKSELNNESKDKENSEDDLDDSEDDDETDEEEYGDEYGVNKLRKMTLAQKPLMSQGDELEHLLRLDRSLDSTLLTSTDQRFMWHRRHLICQHFPQMLPVLADCAIIWRTPKWPPLYVDTAIELLDGRYVDRRVRTLAVKHLDDALDDDQLQLYLLILVQAIRFEHNAFSPLVRMLLRRALMDYRVGHTLFWLFRAELAHLLAFGISSQSSVTTMGTKNSLERSSGPQLSPLFLRFALMFEAYCRGNSAHLDSMCKQVELISTLTTLSTSICANSNREAANKKLQVELLARREQMQHMVSPVNATYRLGELIIEECRVLGSAKQPLLLTWRNPEILARLTAPTHQLIFKCGDDMRQDMLSLHVMRIMDAKWKSQLQQDYCMTLYEVLPMGKNIGLIHVVPDCQTLFQIQCETRKTASLNMDIALLNKYIYKRCCSRDSKKYLECVDRFTMSLAGYCVATYILGIKDRHQDNIMLANDGRIFHIDFGHILGHTKRKLGINRERTDFVLTDHFLYVISRGKTNFRQTYEYNSFRDECTKGFLSLHSQARFFIALFRMMCCMGLPELSPVNVDFLKQTLMYDKEKREEARAAFEQIFEDVVKGDWSIQLNWFFHSVRHM
uniref:Phosphatidylinositol 3-kinase n=1 Tax=Meloidogyne hapla TaxID=6305 RepID=A0A1I8AW80_MELHA